MHAKGLKVRAERTANQLSTQATSAFIPPTEGTDSDQATAAATAGQVGESGGAADIDNGTRGSDGAEGGIADTGDSPPLTLNPNELQEATNEELMSMLRHQSARLQKLEEEYSRLKSKATPGDDGQVAQRELERSQEECQLAKDNARELAERYTALQEKFRTMEGGAGGGHRGADYNKLVERMKGLIGKYKEAQGTIKSLQGQVEELRAHRVATSRIQHDLRDSSSASESNAESSEAAAIEAERQASALREERNAAREEVEAMRGIVQATDGRVLSLSEELGQVRQARNRLDGRRAELQMALGAEKLRRAFGVAGGSGATAAAAANVFEGVFKGWRLACLEGRQGRLKRESEENHARAAELDSAAKAAAARVEELVDRLEAAELRARDADAAAEHQQRQKDALAEAALAAEDTHTRLQSELDQARKEAVVTSERAISAEEEAQGKASELRSELERARGAEEEARATERRLSERLEAASHGLSEQISTLEAQCSQAQQDRLSAEEECRSLAQQLAGLTEEHGVMEGKLAEAKAEAENIRTHGEETMRGMLEEQARVAEHAITAAVREAVDKARADEAARLLVEVKELSSDHTEILARASATAKREVSRVRLEAEEVRAALASELVSAEEQLAAATARAEEFAEDLRAARASEACVTRRVEELEAAKEEQRAIVEAEIESVRRELDCACGAAEDAAGEIERLSAQLESAHNKASFEAATLREQTAAAEGTRQASEGRAAKLSEKLQTAVSMAKKIQAAKEEAEAAVATAGDTVARLESELSSLRAAAEEASANHAAEVTQFRGRLEEEMAASSGEAEGLKREDQVLWDRVSASEADLEAKSAEAARAAAAAAAAVASECEANGPEKRIEELEGERAAALDRARVVEAEVKGLREEERQLYEGAEALEAERDAAVATARAEEEMARSLTEALESTESRKSQVTDVCKQLTNRLEAAEIELRKSMEERIALTTVVAARDEVLATKQARVTELERELVKLEASEQSARERYNVVSSKLKELISRYKELRDSASASESNAESSEAAAIEAERQASALREERNAAREEVEAMRGVVQAADGRALSLSEELEQVRQARNRLDGRRAELQMALGAEKLRRAFGVAGGSGATAAATANVFEGVFKGWRLACLEGRQGRLKRESEENREKAESFQGLVQRLSEELERQGQAVNHHAKVIHQRESELEAARDRANRAHDELIAMEPPSLSQAIGGVEILLRVSTQPAPSVAVAAGTEEKSGAIEEFAGAGDHGGQSENGQEDVWCLVRYEKASPSSKKRGGILRENDVSTLLVEEGEAENGREAGENAPGDHGDEEGDEGAGQAPAQAAVEAKMLAATMTEEWEKHEGEGEAEQAPLTGSPSACGGDDGNGGGDAAAVAPRTAEGEDLEAQPSPPPSLPSSASVAGQDTVVVIEWRTQGEVDEWFAARLETAVEEEDYQEERSRLERAEGDAGGEETAAAMAESSMVASRLLPVLETPLTIQESFAAEMARVEAELNSKLEEAQAKLSSNTEAYKHYRARAHTAIKNSGASQREAEARITQAHRELATERELVRKALEDRAAAEAHWADESVTLKQHIDEVEARVESAAARTAELEAGMARSVEEGVEAAREETAEVRRRFKEQEAATAEAREALAMANAELEKARRELKQRGQLARNLLAEKDVEISRLRSGGRGVGAGVSVGGLGGEISPDANGDTLSFQQRKASPGAFEGVSSLSPDPASDSVVCAPHSLGAAAKGTGTDGTSPDSMPDGRGGRKRIQEGGGEKGPAHQQQKTAADSHHAEQQILQMARVQSQRDEEVDRLRVKLQRQSEEIRAREERLAVRDEEKERLRKHIEELEAEATRSKDLLDQEHGREKMTYLKNVVKKFVVSEGNERHRLVPVLATILSFSPAELSEVDKAVSSAARSGGSSWTSMFGSA